MIMVKVPFSKATTQNDFKFDLNIYEGGGNSVAWEKKISNCINGTVRGMLCKLKDTRVCDTLHLL